MNQHRQQPGMIEMMQALTQSSVMTANALQQMGETCAESDEYCIAGESFHFVYHPKGGIARV